MRESLSPEDKLLRLIKGHKQPQAVVKKIQKFKSFLDTRKIILFFFIAACLYLALSLIYPLFAPRKINLPKVTTEKAAPEASEKTEIKPYEYYLQGLKDKQIFSNASRPEAQAANSGVNLDLIKDINLVGIIAGEKPQAIIEDKKTQKNYYLGKGQFFGEFQIEDIQEGKVILNYHGQRFELYL